MSSAWRKAARTDAAPLAAWLAEREAWACAFVWRAYGPPRPGAGFASGVSIYMDAEGSSIHGALLLGSGGLAFPVFERAPDREARAFLAGLYARRGSAPASCMGRADDVALFEDAIQARPAFGVDYVSMVLPPHAALALESKATPFDVQVRAAGADDLAALAPLQADYEREEVLTPLHRFDIRASRAALGASLAEQRVFMATVRGAALGKAQTNARASRYEQIGGVYVDPAFRGRGLGRALMLPLLRAIGEGGKAATLFVKRANAPARALYTGLGFQEAGPFRIDYWPG